MSIPTAKEYLKENLKKNKTSFDGWILSISTIDDFIVTNATEVEKEIKAKSSQQYSPEMLASVLKDMEMTDVAVVIPDYRAEIPKEPTKGYKVVFEMATCPRGIPIATIGNAVAFAFKTGFLTKLYRLKINREM